MRSRQKSASSSRPASVKSSAALPYCSLASSGRFCFCFKFRIDQQIEEHSVVNRGALRLFLPRVQITQRLSGLGMRWRVLQHSKIRVNGILGAVLFEEFLGAFQLLVDVGHSGGLPLRSLSVRSLDADAARLGAVFAPKLYTVRKIPAKPPLHAMRNRAPFSCAMPPAVLPAVIPAFSLKPSFRGACLR